MLEIEFAERLLMEGLNYEFCCHHSISTIDEIYSSLTSLSGSNDNSHCKVHEDYERFRRQSIDVAMKLLIFSDTPFLFNPCHAGFAICAIVMGVVTKAGYMGATLQEHLHKKSALTAASMTEHMLFADTVRSAIQSLLQCSALDLRPNGRTSEETAAARAENLRRVLGEVASIRLLQKMKRVHPQQAFVSHKRMRIEYDFTLPRLLQSRKYAKVTPTGQQAVEND